MAKFLLVIAVFIVVYLILRRYRGKVNAPPSPGAQSGEDMVRCRVCGIHLPKSEAVTSRGEFFCGKEHLLAAQDRGNR